MKLDNDHLKYTASRAVKLVRYGLQDLADATKRGTDKLTDQLWLLELKLLGVSKDKKDRS